MREILLSNWRNVTSVFVRASVKFFFELRHCRFFIYLVCQTAAPLFFLARASIRCTIAFYRLLSHCGVAVCLFFRCPEPEHAPEILGSRLSSRITFVCICAIIFSVEHHLNTQWTQQDRSWTTTS